MLFDSPAYFIFLIPVVLVYWRLNRRGQNVVLLFASYFFYGWWDWRFVALMIGSTTADFLIAQKIAPGCNEANRRKWFIFSLILNFSILGTFKYFDFFVGSFSGALNTLGIHNIPLPLIRIILPPGISFYTFQEVAYIVDVYKGRIEPVKSFVEYGLFVSLFAHLIAGPIQRPGHLIPQVQNDRAFDANRFFDGLMLIFSGLIRKCVVADNCALLANAAFGGQFGEPNFWIVLIGTYAFAWQVYGDFSGYSDIARGSAQLLGFHFMINFRQPFLSYRLQDLWRRWHISLSTWLRDYLYIPLGGSVGGKWQTCKNLMITMVLAGLWHGANWTFVIFGAIHGVVLSLERLIWPAARKGDEVARRGPFAAFLLLWSQRILTFNIFCFSLAFFRATSLSAAVEFLFGLSNFAWRSEYATALLMLCLFSVPLFIVDLVMEASNQEYPFAKASYAFRTGLATAALVVLALFSGNTFNAFIYFRF
ncbi:MAG TPA: MBOAT family O-acyltransferase [Candidatus Acidoferrales bacterium]|nr:MBOAT family O-acyltransferase [Candidatus Acidoferrales bacterium]